MIQLTLFTIWVCFLTVVGSWFFELSFAVTFAFVTILIVFGHVITLDEDLKGGWNNPEGNKSIRNRSLLELVVKLFFSVVVWILVVRFPELSGYGI